MKLLTKPIEKKLIDNWNKNKDDKGIDFKPVVKFFTPDAGATWLITEYCKDDDVFFGLCDLGLGSPELGYVSYTELKELRGGLNLPVERDMYFKADKTISEYATEANKTSRITA